MAVYKSGIINNKNCKIVKSSQIFMNLYILIAYIRMCT